EECKNSKMNVHMATLPRVIQIQIAQPRFSEMNSPAGEGQNNERKIKLMETHLKIFTTVLFVFACCAFLPQVQAATDTPDPGGNPGLFNTADGDRALFNGAGTIANSAFGSFAQFANGTGNGNTAVGALALD